LGTTVPLRAASTIAGLRHGTQRFVSGAGKSMTVLICSRIPSLVGFRSTALLAITATSSPSWEEHDRLFQDK